ncbi:MAG: 2-C-methyl-D-erythritol 2,4-cyclodiphosphate synthase [Candidatus Electronema aureum]|uniref:Bifunctional enzyme IspD/IspF n=1 Tax=Candidatus Electronema aureum TaxID=2005002 RepID=A0A521G1J1_9BACT|nr:MAG: 2-C-methyl-D-erythritol 2,4-cyclodiphosphate synthase [Candidatus Electronema aureum]
MHSQNSPPSVGIIIPAAGFGTRMGASVPKQFLELAGMPVLARTLRVFLEHPNVHAVVAVLPPEHLQAGTELLRPFLNFLQQQELSFTAGGATRQQSVRNGLAALPATVERVLVHDGARPLVTAEIIDRCLSGIEQHGAVIAAVPVKDTLKEIEQGAVLHTVDRARLWQAQTPQGATRMLLEQAHQHAEASGFIGTDEASLLEHAGISVNVVMGSERNFKITQPEDLAIAAALLRREENTMRIGHGFDAHRLVEGRKLILGGQEIPYHLGLAGHSDADVLIHALMDAILGALGEGDIGRHFPDSNEQYRGADSLKLLARVMELVRVKKMRIINADITVICQQPKLAPHMAAMKANLCAACAMEEINIKATTTEKMGYTGRGEGISTHAVVLLALR